MCQMCEEYEAELRRLGIAMDEKRIVRSTVANRRMTADEFEERANAIAAMTPKGTTQTDSAALLREDRNR
jgi:hypothetical protein